MSSWTQPAFLHLQRTVSVWTETTNLRHPLWVSEQQKPQTFQAPLQNIEKTNPTPKPQPQNPQNPKTPLSWTPPTSHFSPQPSPRFGERYWDSFGAFRRRQLQALNGAPSPREVTTTTSSDGEVVSGGGGKSGVNIIFIFLIFCVFFPKEFTVGFSLRKKKLFEKLFGV